MSVHIPAWLSHLRTDARGVPVPFVNQWGVPEDPRRYFIRHDRLVKAPALFYEDDHETIPDFTRVNVQRQRQAVLEGLCQVCGRQTVWSNRFLAIAPSTVDTLEVDGHVVPTTFEPWLCKMCALFAVKHCPALIRRREDEQLQLIPVTAREQFGYGYTAGIIDQLPLGVASPATRDIAEETARVRPIHTVKVVLRALHLDTLRPVAEASR